MNALEAAGLLGNPKLYARKPEKTADGRKYFSDCDSTSSQLREKVLSTLANLLNRPAQRTDSHEETKL